jgi:hypothetical protein
MWLCKCAFPLGIVIVFLLTIPLLMHVNVASSIGTSTGESSKLRVIYVANTTDMHQYSNYTSDPYQIQFSYPSDWQVDEKTGRFDEGSDLKIIDPVSFRPFILIQHSNDPITDFGSKDVRSATFETFKTALTGDYKNDHKVIEQPSFLTLDGQKAGTFLYTSKDKYDDNAWTWGTQVWLVYVGGHAYLVSYSERTDSFDSPENTQIRDHFIKSINFLGNTTNTNATSRFD